MNNYSRISKATGVILIAVAGLIDGLQFLVSLLGFVPFVGFAIVAIVNPLISFLAFMLFGIWFSHLNVSQMSPERALGTLATLLFEVVPIFDALPLWAARIAYTVIAEWKTKTDI